MEIYIAVLACHGRNEKKYCGSFVDGVVFLFVCVYLPESHGDFWLPHSEA